ncbi:penicillin-binding protein PbpB [Actinoplanes sp. OR16]|uniref:peptidoglycan D,D-transpeptidase FtsI family protein n=1 Tax=Actinoplanes sp. OR16 TaxID=946334 RepID=UPI000F6EB3D0|nr:penicillin-binding protein 2 [Actinoplanes sp. OR16]BBH66943.1 penicillin-binding protein PbpB [Actinoplanes sp. OR16]
MSPRDDETPRRGTQPRRGSSRDLPAEEPEETPGRRNRSSIGDARAYTPRGRTVAERGRLPRSGRTTDPFRPALQVLDGGETPPRVRGRGRDQVEKDEPATTAARRPEKERDKAVPRTKESPAKEGRARAGGASPRTGKDRAEREREAGRGAGPRRRPPARSGRGRPDDRRSTEKRVPAEPPKLANSTRRLRLGTVLALSLFVTIGVRLVVLQVATSPDEAESLLALRERRLSTVELPAPRGSILDSSGAVLAHSVEARYVYADPENAGLQKNIAGTAAKLAPLLRVPASELAVGMERKQSLGRWLKFRYLARGVDVGIADKIDDMELPGIYTHTDERRDVPGKDLAANLIGFTGDDHHGLEGLEARYDELLHGTDGKRVFEVGKGSLNVQITGGYEQYTAAKPGNSLQLTIDRDVQYEVQRILDAEAEKKKATVAGAVVLDARTGEVLAQASYPAYNAAKPEDSDAEDRADVPSSVVTDPGSSHKAFIFGAALQEGVITPDSTMKIGPGLERGGYPFRDTHPQDPGTEMTMPGLLAYSSNVGTILIAEKLGKEKVYEYQKLFGLGQATGEGVLGEADGQLLEPSQWSGSAYGSVPIGHSVSATLIQMAAAYGAIANDGTYIQPQLIKATISGADGTVTPAAAPKTHKVLDPQVASQLRTMMEAVVDVKGGTGGAAAVPGYRVAGKTGTGKMLTDGQYTSHNASSFIGMAPAENPRYVIAVSMDVATGGGGDVAAPAFSEMMSYALLHYRVPPSGTKPPTFKIHP